MSNLVVPVNLPLQPDFNQDLTQYAQQVLGMYQRLAAAINNPPSNTWGTASFTCHFWGPQIAGNTYASITANTIPKVLGLAANPTYGPSFKVTATKTGRQLVIVTLKEGHVGVPINWSLCYGTGTPPAAGATAVGTRMDGQPIGTVQGMTAFSQGFSPVAIAGIMLGAVGATTWFDVVYGANSSIATGVQNGSVMMCDV